MERAARLIKNNKYSRQVLSDDDIVRGVWPAAVGKAIARHTIKLRVIRASLIVEVEDAIWQKQLYALSAQIVSRLQMLLGPAMVQEIEFRIAVPRRQPQRAEAMRPAAGVSQADLFDEADQIQDPVLKKIYRLSRKRATA